MRHQTRRFPTTLLTRIGSPGGGQGQRMFLPSGCNSYGHGYLPAKCVSRARFRFACWISCGACPPQRQPKFAKLAPFLLGDFVYRSDAATPIYERAGITFGTMIAFRDLGIMGEVGGLNTIKKIYGTNEPGSFMAWFECRGKVLIFRSHDASKRIEITAYTI